MAEQHREAVSKQLMAAKAAASRQLMVAKAAMEAAEAAASKAASKASSATESAPPLTPPRTNQEDTNALAVHAWTWEAFEVLVLEVSGEPYKESKSKYANDFYKLGHEDCYNHEVKKFWNGRQVIVPLCTKKIPSKASKVEHQLRQIECVMTGVKVYISIIGVFTFFVDGKGLQELLFRTGIDTRQYYGLTSDSKLGPVLATLVLLILEELRQDVFPAAHHQNTQPYLPSQSHTVIGELSIKHIYETAQIKVADAGNEDSTLEAMTSCMLAQARGMDINAKADGLLLSELLLFLRAIIFRAKEFPHLQRDVATPTIQKLFTWLLQKVASSEINSDIVHHTLSEYIVLGSVFPSMTKPFTDKIEAICVQTLSSENVSPRLQAQAIKALVVAIAGSVQLAYAKLIVKCLQCHARDAYPMEWVTSGLRSLVVAVAVADAELKPRLEELIHAHSDVLF
ncbi:hypothetical protein HDU78_009506, partial [Chytriomyces hyalinus]